MDGDRFDRLARCLAEFRRSRRGALRTGGVGLAATALAAIGLAARGRGSAAGQTVLAGAMPSTQGTPFACPAATADEIHVEGAWFCNQLYALCTTAPCELSASDPTIANCRCFVIDGYSIGFKSCAERAQSGDTLVSNFSTQNVNSSFRILTCPDGAPWANCLDMPCRIDSFNPGEAICQCQVVETGVSLTFGGGCDTSTCTSVIWSAATPDLPGSTQYATAMQCVNQEVMLPPTCPSATPVASPSEATPVG